MNTTSLLPILVYRHIGTLFSIGSIGIGNAKGGNLSFQGLAVSAHPYQFGGSLFVD